MAAHVGPFGLGTRNAFMARTGVNNCFASRLPQQLTAVRRKADVAKRQRALTADLMPSVIAWLQDAQSAFTVELVSCRTTVAPGASSSRFRR